MLDDRLRQLVAGVGVLPAAARTESSASGAPLHTTASNLASEAESRRLISAASLACALVQREAAPSRCTVPRHPVQIRLSCRHKSGGPARLNIHTCQCERIAVVNRRASAHLEFGHLEFGLRAAQMERRRAFEPSAQAHARLRDCSVPRHDPAAAACAAKCTGSLSGTRHTRGTPARAVAPLLFGPPCTICPATRPANGSQPSGSE